MTLHDGEELDDDLRRGADKHLALAAALSVDNVVLRSFRCFGFGARENREDLQGSRSNIA